MNQFDLYHLCCFVSPHLPVSQRDRVTECVDLARSVENLQTAFAESQADLLRYSNTVLSRDFALWRESVVSCETANLSEWTIVSCLAAIHETIESAGELYDIIFSRCADDHLRNQFEAIKSRLRSFPFDLFLDETIQHWAVGDARLDATITHLIFRLGCLTKCSSRDLYERTTSLLSFETPLIVGYFAAACLKHPISNQFFPAICQTDEQYAVMQMLESFTMLPGARCG